MRRLKWITPAAWLLATLLFLTACGIDLQKPTGLEDQTSEQVLDADSSEADVKDRTSSRADEESEQTDEEETSSKDDEAKEGQTTANERDVAKSSGSEEKSDKSSTSSNSDATENSNRSVDKKTDTKTNGDSKSKSSSGKSSSSPDSNTTNDDKKSKDSSKKKEEKKEPSPPAETKNTITISVVISDSEVPLSATEMEIEDGVSALDALIDITMDHGVHLDYRGGTGASGYVQGLGNLYEFDRGPGSGWMFRVNGIFPNRGAGVTPLLGGDRVEWLYTENLGEDLGADLQPFR